MNVHLIPSSLLTGYFLVVLCTHFWRLEFLRLQGFRNPLLLLIFQLLPRQLQLLYKLLHHKSDLFLCPLESSQKSYTHRFRLCRNQFDRIGFCHQHYFSSFGQRYHLLGWSWIRQLLVNDRLIPSSLLTGYFLAVLCRHFWKLELRRFRKRLSLLIFQSFLLLLRLLYISYHRKWHLFLWLLEFFQRSCIHTFPLGHTW